MAMTQADNPIAVEVDVAIMGGGISSGMMGLDMRFFARLEH